MERLHSWLEAQFYRTLHGAEVGDLFMTLIHTGQLCGVNSCSAAPGNGRSAGLDDGSVDLAHTARPDRFEDFMRPGFVTRREWHCPKPDKCNRSGRGP